MQKLSDGNKDFLLLLVCSNVLNRRYFSLPDLSPPRFPSRGLIPLRKVSGRPNFYLTYNALVYRRQGHCRFLSGKSIQKRKCRFRCKTTLMRRQQARQENYKVSTVHRARLKPTSQRQESIGVWVWVREIVYPLKCVQTLVAGCHTLQDEIICCRRRYVFYPCSTQAQRINATNTIAACDKESRLAQVPPIKSDPKLIHTRDREPGRDLSSLHASPDYLAHLSTQERSLSAPRLP